jgi:hypothetical protein
MSITPFLIETTYNTFDDYLHKLTKKSLYNYKNIIKKYNNITFELLSINDGKYYKPIFEKIWSKQLIRGKHIKMPNLPITENTIFFCCKENNKIILLHIVEYYSNYVYCHMPMYDKQKYNELAKFSWFHFIKYIIENTNKLGIDMGGVCGKSVKHKCNGNCNPHFKYIVDNREKYDKYTYKFLYLTRDEKNISKSKPYIIINNSLTILT